MSVGETSQLKEAELRERLVDHRPSVSSLGPERVHTVALEFQVFALFCLTLERRTLTCSLYKDLVFTVQ